MITYDATKNRFFSLGLMLFLIILIIYFGYLHYRYNSIYGLDDSYITYRYAFNFADGYGLVFNLGEKHYGSTAAGYAVILGSIAKSIVVLTSFFTPDDKVIFDLKKFIPDISRALSTLSVMLSSLLLTIISWQSFGFKLGSAIGVFIIVTIFLAEPASAVVGHETYFFLVLWLLASFLSLFKGRYFSAAIILALATAVRPDTLLFAGVLFIIMAFDSLRSGEFRLAMNQIWRPAVLYIILIGIWFLVLWIYYGQPLPETKTAKQAQVILGHWKTFSPTIIIKYLSNSLRASSIFLIAVGVVSVTIKYIVKYFSTNKKNTVKKLNRSLFYFSLVWVIVGGGLVTSYSAMGVTYWTWYGVPIWFAVICLLPGFFKIIHDAVLSLPNSREGMVSLGVFALIAVLIMYDLKAFAWVHNKMKSELHRNDHIGSYDEAVFILKEEAPEGASIAIAEPGYVGFMLGPKYQLIDTLGLASPGVSRAIIKGDMDYPFEKWSPEFVISSWKGKYDPTQRAWFHDAYSLHSELTHPYWTKGLGGPYQIYKKREFQK